MHMLSVCVCLLWVRTRELRTQTNGCRKTVDEESNTRYSMLTTPIVRNYGIKRLVPIRGIVKPLTLNAIHEAEIHAEERIESVTSRLNRAVEFRNQNRVHVEHAIVLVVRIGCRHTNDERRPLARRLAGRGRFDQFHIVGGCWMWEI